MRSNWATVDSPWRGSNTAWPVSRENSVAAERISNAQEPSRLVTLGSGSQHLDRFDSVQQMFQAAIVDPESAAADLVGRGEISRSELSRDTASDVAASCLPSGAGQ